MGTCKECRHWSGRADKTDYGLCKYEESVEDVLVDFWADPNDRIVPYDGGWLATGPDASCGHFTQDDAIRGRSEPRGTAVKATHTLEFSAGLKPWGVYPYQHTGNPHFVSIWGPRDGDRKTPLKIECVFPNGYTREDVQAELNEFLDQYFTPPAAE